MTLNTHLINQKPIISAEEFAGEMNMPPDRIKNIINLANGQQEENQQELRAGAFTLVQSASLISMNETQRLTSFEKIEQILAQNVLSRIEWLFTLLQKANISVEELDLYNFIMSLLATEEVALHIFTNILGKIRELVICHEEKLTLNNVSAEDESKGITRVSFNTPESFQLYRFAYTCVMDTERNLSAMVSRKLNREELNYVKQLTESADTELSKLAKSVLLGAQFMRLNPEISGELSDQLSIQINLLEKVFACKAGAASIVSAISPIFLCAAQQTIRTVMRDANGGRITKSVLKSHEEIFNLWNLHKGAQRALYLQMYDRITKKSSGLRAQEKIRILSFRSNKDDLFGRGEKLPLPQDYLKEEMVAVKVETAQKKKASSNKKVTSKKKPAKAAKAPSAKKEPKQLPVPEPVLQETAAKVVSAVNEEEWLSKPLEFTLGPRVRRWLALAPGDGAPYATFPLSSAKEAEIIRIRHAFSTIVDQVTHLDQYVVKNSEKTSIYAVAQMDYADGVQERGIIGWGLDRTAEKVHCFHRYFTPHTINELIAENYKTAFFKSDFPTLGETINPPETETLIDNNIAKVTRTESLNILQFNDLKNQVVVSIFPMEQKVV